MPEQPRRFDQRRYAAPGPAPAPAPIVRRPHRARAGHATGGLPRTAGPAARREPLRGRVRLRAGLGHLRRTGGLRVGAGDRLLEGERGARAPERDVLARHQRRGPRLFGGHLPTCHRRLRRAVEPRWARGHSGPALDRRHGQSARPGTDAEPRSHPEFWRQVGTAFKGNDRVVFDLFNEPFPDSNADTPEAWRCWRDGGTCRGMSFQAAGMQELVDAVRVTGATNVIIVGGV